MAITKLLLLFLMLIGQHYVGTPPNVRPPTEQLREQRGLELVVPYLTIFLKALGWIWTCLEGAVLFALSGHCPHILAWPILNFLVPTSTPALAAGTLTTLTPTFIGGTFLVFSGILLRVHCYYTLGSRFTFELAIRPQHALVTGGVYSVVRHPSYTGALVLRTGLFLCISDPHGVCAHWAQAFGGGENRCSVGAAILMCTCLTMLGLLLMWLIKRMDKEDAMLERHFREEWRAWEKRVPYRLVPGLY